VTLDYLKTSLKILWELDRDGCVYTCRVVREGIIFFGVRCC
jgi:hypothetical protein